MGFLEKKRKNLSSFQKRWFVLISSKPFLTTESPDTVSPQRITEDQLPPWMELDTLFYFHYKTNDDKSPFIRKIPLRNFVSMEIENQNQQHGILDETEGYSFKLVTKERTFHFKAELITEMNKWILALEGSRKNYVDMHPETTDSSYVHHTNSGVSTQHKVVIRDNTFGPCEEPVSVNTLVKRSTSAVTPIRKSIDSKEKVETPKNVGTPKNIGKEGYLMKKSMHKLHKLLGWEKRYVTLKNDTFFWSISNINVERRNTINIKDLEKCEILKENQFILVIFLIFIINK